jgi:hypothetical protein
MCLTTFPHCSITLYKEFRLKFARSIITVYHMSKEMFGISVENFSGLLGDFSDYGTFISTFVENIHILCRCMINAVSNIR